jgi:hypothetical protein
MGKIDGQDIGKNMGEYVLEDNELSYLVSPNANEYIEEYKDKVGSINISGVDTEQNLSEEKRIEC